MAMTHPVVLPLQLVSVADSVRAVTKLKEFTVKLVRKPDDVTCVLALNLCQVAAGIVDVVRAVPARIGLQVNVVVRGVDVGPLDAGHDERGAAPGTSTSGRRCPKS
jgi:hypothetical protein